MPAQHPADLRERVFEFVCAVVHFCRELSKEPGVDRHLRNGDARRQERLGQSRPHQNLVGVG